MGGDFRGGYRGRGNFNGPRGGMNQGGFNRNFSGGMGGGFNNNMGGGFNNGMGGGNFGGGGFQRGGGFGGGMRGGPGMRGGRGGMNNPMGNMGMGPMGGMPMGGMPNMNMIGGGMPGTTPFSFGFQQQHLPRALYPIPGQTQKCKQYSGRKSKVAKPEQIPAVEPKRQKIQSRSTPITEVGRWTKASGLLMTPTAPLGLAPPGDLRLGHFRR